FLKSDQTPPEAYQELWATIANGGIWRGVFQNRKKNGESFWLSSTVCPVRDQDNKISRYISISEDITDARKRESMLVQAMKLEAIGRMTDGIAHDFNNLLTIIRGNLKLLEQDINTKDEDIRELVEDALSAAQDGADLIKRLLAFSRRHDLKMQTTDINKNLAAMDRLLQRSVPDANIIMELSPEIGHTLIDTNRLESAVLNLVTNARDAMPEGGNIVISTSAETVNWTIADNDLTPGEYVVLTVRDNGIGMDDKTKRQAVEPFFTTKTIETGTGLGLTMVHDFVQQCDGRLFIESAPGKGASIKMMFPSVEAPDAWINETEIDIDMPTGHETILVVEDREKVRRFACRTLSRLGYQTHAAENSNEALKQLQRHPDIDLLFTDIVMPGNTNGRGLAQLVMSTHPAIRVLLTTGMEPINEKVDGDARNIPLLYKPYSIEELAQSVRAALDSKTRN
ncbi:MAG TPA: ATP-binding protein, partial [Gammaproteobacteria bacterium]|nr:ATP-binding protein [Gammaproteobacteria bacterium]